MIPVMNIIAWGKRKSTKAPYHPDSCSGLKLKTGSSRNTDILARGNAYHETQGSPTEKQGA